MLLNSLARLLSRSRRRRRRRLISLLRPPPAQPSTDPGPSRRPLSIHPEARRRLRRPSPRGGVRVRPSPSSCPAPVRPRRAAPGRPCKCEQAPLRLLLLSPPPEASPGKALAARRRRDPSVAVLDSGGGAAPLLQAVMLFGAAGLGALSGAARRAHSSAGWRGSGGGWARPSADLVWRCAAPRSPRDGGARPGGVLVVLRQLLVLWIRRMAGGGSPGHAWLALAGPWFSGSGCFVAARGCLVVRQGLGSADSVATPGESSASGFWPGPATATHSGAALFLKTSSRCAVCPARVSGR